jgi:hypothetical protein
MRLAALGDSTFDLGRINAVRLDFLASEKPTKLFDA